MSKTVLDGLRYVLQNMRLQEGQMAKVQADIVAQAIIEIETLKSLNSLNLSTRSKRSATEQGNAASLP